MKKFELLGFRKNNSIDVTVYLTIKGIENPAYKLINTQSFEFNDSRGVIFQVSNDSDQLFAEINNYDFKHQFTVRTKIQLDVTKKEIHVFYLNDNDENNLDEEIVNKCKKCIGNNESDRLGDFEEFFILRQPRQAGNGGVLGIIDIP